MSPRDAVYVGHMLDTGGKAIGAHPEIPWADIIGMRHKVVHDYLGVDEDIVWQVVTEDLPGLAVLLSGLVPESSA